MIGTRFEDSDVEPLRVTIPTRLIVKSYFGRIKYSGRLCQLLLLMKMRFIVYIRTTVF